MMTTDLSERHRPTAVAGLGVLGGAACVTVASGLLLAAVGAAADGAPAAFGAVVGASLAAVVLLLGTFPMNLVAQVVPKLTLAFALLTYLFQLMALIAALVALDQAGLVGDELSRGWLGAAIMVGVASWVVAHVVLASRARIPVYTLPAGDGGDHPQRAAGTTPDPGAR